MNKELDKYLLSIVIVNYNGEKFLKNGLDSIATYCGSFNYEVIVVDNNSIDGSIYILENQFPNCILIKNSDNKGFAAGNNIGVLQAQGEYILLLNNDTILIENIQPAIDLFKGDQKIGIIGIKMLDGNSEFISSAGKFPKFYHFLSLKSILFTTKEIEEKASIDKNLSFDVDWVSGSFILTSKYIWEEVNGLDENYFMYVEDVDFNKKVNQLGKKTIFLPTLSYIHFVGFKGAKEQLLINSFRIYIQKYFKGVTLVLSLFMLNTNSIIKKFRRKI